MGGFFPGELLQAADSGCSNTRGQRGCVEDFEANVWGYEAGRYRCIADRGTPAQSARAAVTGHNLSGRCHRAISEQVSQILSALGGLRLGRGGRFDGRQPAVDHRVDRPRRVPEFSLKPDLDLRGVERIEAHLDGVTGQIGRRLVETVVQQEGGIAAHQAIQAMEEETVQVGGRRELADLLDVALPAQQRSGPESAMFGTVIDTLDPDPEAVV